MKRCFLLTLSLFLACLAYPQKVVQFIPNPSFQITTNELEFAKSLEKYGQSGVVLTPTDDLKKIAEKIGRDTTIHSKVDGWTTWHNLQEKSATQRVSQKVKNHARQVVLDMANPDFLGTYLNAPLEAGKVYTVVCKFSLPEKLHDLPAREVPALGFAVLPATPAEGQARIKPDKVFTFKQDKDAKHYARRQAIVDNFQKEYGGNYQSKDWDGFQGKKSKKERFETITFTFKAQGGEKYLVLGNFNTHSANLKPAFLMSFERLYLYDKANYSSVED